MKVAILLALLSTTALAADPPSPPKPIELKHPTVNDEVIYFAAHHGVSDYLRGAVDGTMDTIPGAVRCKFSYADLDTFLAQMLAEKPETTDLRLSIAVSVAISTMCEHGTSA